MIKSWMVIGGLALLLAVIGGSILPPKGVQWFNRLRRPRWLTFEKLIPVIWTFVLSCGVWSAVQVWEQDPGSRQTWMLMAGYAILEVAILAYSPALMIGRSLKLGMIVGAVGFGIGLILTLAVLNVSSSAALLLLPFLIWSPIGTYTTWAMLKLNSTEA
ncbi:MAG: tryptophan-rich sensory protein [Pegethrix bostrychoides GSE-TBD4-15B]|jgi:tryptophan-rich sensory protein|uniref:Tryptophan-rich sensory protein n=1 Tax=Pegethrix bostrychoides GSE-TBD4-15B TaxID=2839662 RepID=A0A951PEX7_9CYAN|nr:tryptophan-rich sensory protein [Pegethrix bostrychoides GSE-TBD4-15B]